MYANRATTIEREERKKKQMDIAGTSYSVNFQSLVQRVEMLEQSNKKKDDEILTLKAKIKLLKRNCRKFCRILERNNRGVVFYGFDSSDSGSESYASSSNNEDDDDGKSKKKVEQEEEEEEEEEEVGGGGGGGEGTKDDEKNERQEEKEEAKKEKKKEKEEEEEEEGEDESKNDDHDLGGSYGGNEDANTEEKNKDGGPSSIVKRLKEKVDRKSTLTRMVKDYLVGCKYKKRHKNPTTTIDASSDKNVGIIDAGTAQDSRDLIWKEDTTYSSIWVEDLSLCKLLSSEAISNDIINCWMRIMKTMLNEESFNRQCNISYLCMESTI
ncbi:uncharacterized protein [Elaeis guineensis]|uniref:uncharacterized protein isoform X2 n=1 Tax=Elaeis guineensis var. tenera TaxID=51953 RepID=UPI003C6D3995